MRILYTVLLELSAISFVFAVVLVCLLPCPAFAQQAGSVSLGLHLDADSAELIRAWRRQQGLDPPDPAADRRVADILQRRAAVQGEDLRRERLRQGLRTAPRDPAARATGAPHRSDTPSEQDAPRRQGG